jgi:RNA polymerase sigma-70 factor (ECF subfamily)
MSAIAVRQVGSSWSAGLVWDIRAVRPRGGRGTLAESPMHADESRTEISPDTRLGRRLSAGQPEAVSELYDLLGTTIWSMARRTFPGAVAEEIVQDVLMQVWTRREQYEVDRGTLTAWVLRIARNRITDVVRAQRARPRLEPWQPTMDGRLHDQDQASLWDHAWLAEQRRALRSALDELHERERDVIGLAYYGFSQREIADRLGVPLGTVKTRSRAALQKLRARLAEQNLLE